MMKKMDKKAFTLIELLVVIAVVGILVLLAAPRFTGYTQKAELIRIQHDTKVMEEEVGTVLINGDDEFNEWENNMKDLNQLAQEDKLFEKEGHVTGDVDDSHLRANETAALRKYSSQQEQPNKINLNVGGELYSLSEDLSISETYKVIPERYKDEINSKLKGTFYANSDGKVYYEHVKSLSRILTKPEEPGEPGEEEQVYSEEEIKDLIENHDFIPVAWEDELYNVRYADWAEYGKGTPWYGWYVGGLDKQYVQVKDIDSSGYSQDGWNPIGTFDFDNPEPFTGIYDGANYVITNLDVNGGDGEGYQGLFGYTKGADIRNVGLIDSTVTVTGSDPWLPPLNVGSLVGRADNSTIDNSYATGSVTGSGDSVGGLVGYAKDGMINNSYSDVSVEGVNDVGGLVGNVISTTGNTATISNSYAIGSVAGERKVGGLAGYVGKGTKISNSYAEGPVEGSGSLVGGLAGFVHWSTIEDSYATGPVTGGADEIGGFVGKTYTSVTISNSYATGAVTGPVDPEAVYDSHGGRNRASRHVGGLVGHADNGTKISNSYAKGSVIGGERVGGLVGLAESSITKISSSYATGSVTGSGDQVGGFVGYANSGTIENSHATGEVKGSGHYVGGLVGHAGSTKISNSYAEGKVTGARHHVGGLVGSARGITIENSYATGSVTGSGDATGGLVGQAQNSTTISNSYATGLVEGANRVGGLVGWVYNNTGTVTTNSYWDISTTGQETSAGEGEGKSTEQMKKQTTYSGWDFDTVWNIVNGEYPKLR